MFKITMILSFALATALSPVVTSAQAETAVGSQILKLRPGGGGGTPGNFSAADTGATASTVNCGASNAHYALCTKIKANCDKIHENAPNHGCGCTKDKEGNLGTCETGV